MCLRAVEKPIYICADCEEGIYEGDTYVEIDGEYYHTECIEDMDIWEVLELINIRAETAEREDYI